MVQANPLLGVAFHWLGGLASASFYVPFRAVKRWSWETYWLVGGVFSWIVVPLLLGWLTTCDLLGTLIETPRLTLLWSYSFGVLWGLGGLTFGLTIRYLGMSLGVAMVLGYCAAFGTLIPPIFSGEFGQKVLGTGSGRTVLFGIVICLLGIALAGAAGISKEREMPEEKKRQVIKEFNFRRGLLAATFSGIMSACFSYGLQAGRPIREITLRHGTAPLWQGLPVLVVVLLGGFTTNAVWCLALNVRNRSGSEYFETERTQVTAEADQGSGSEDVAMSRKISVLEQTQTATERVPIGANYLFSAIAGTTWYFQFFFYTMGETQMGAYAFSSWTLHMASIIIFGTVWGIGLKEWRGASLRTLFLLVVSLLMLLGSTVIVGYGNYFGLAATPYAQARNP